MTTGKAKIYSYRLHRDPTGEGKVMPVKGTAEGIRKYMMTEPLLDTEEEVDASLLDEEGFYRAKEHTKPSAETS
jgi:hypothetical protein